MKIILFLLLLLSIPLLVPAYTIRGIVQQKGDAAPIAGAIIIVENTNLGAVSDIDGQFAIYDVPVGEYNLSLNYPDFCPENYPVTVNKDSRLIFATIEMKPTETGELVLCPETSYHKELKQKISANDSLIVFDTEHYWMGNPNVLVIIPTITNNSADTLYIPYRSDVYRIILNNRRFYEAACIRFLENPDYKIPQYFSLEDIKAVEPGKTEQLQGVFIDRRKLPEDSNISLDLTYLFDSKNIRIRTNCQPLSGADHEKICRILRVPLAVQTQIAIEK